MIDGYHEMIKQIKEAVALYSSKGDGSLEYLGLNTDLIAQLDIKLYRDRFPKGVVLSDAPDCVKELVRNTESQCPSLRFADYSERRLGSQERLYSVSFLTLKDYVADNCFSSASKKIMTVFGKKKEPQIQQGFLIDSKGNILESRAYYTLNSDERLPMWHRRMAFLKERRDSIVSYMTEMLSPGSQLFSEKLFDYSCSHGYRMFLAGINLSPDKTENKLYFVYDCEKDRERQKRESVLFTDEFGTAPWIKDIIELCDEHHLLLKGYACSITDGKPLWRLYFKEM